MINILQFQKNANKTVKTCEHMHKYLKKKNCSTCLNHSELPTRYFNERNTYQDSHAS